MEKKKAVIIGAGPAGLTAAFELLFAAFWLVQMVFFVVFNLKYPFSCTMDFRYIVPTALLGSIFIASASRNLPGERLKKLFGVTAAGAATCLSVLAVVMFCSII